MKRLLRNALLVSTLPIFAWSTSAAAQAAQTPQARPQAPMVDSNTDRAISANEHAVAAEAMFKRMDTDRDGYLTAAEITSGRRMMPATGGQHGMHQGHQDMGPTKGQGAMEHAAMGHGAMASEMMDRDGDGAISAEEHARMAKAMFERMDRDGDGKVSAGEMAQGRPKMRGAGMEGAGRGAGAMGMTGAGATGTDLMGAGLGMGLSPDQHIELMDLDKDGRVSASEYVAGARALFAEADADGNGELSMDERTAHHREMMQRMMDTGAEAGDGG
ncbi:MAG: EF-hand domain-containing protein [Pseudomonadota bacterium]|nr:EF-hand domain-containing protein [Pseudomonadota bacterium]